MTGQGSDWPDSSQMFILGPIPVTGCCEWQCSQNTGIRVWTPISRAEEGGRVESMDLFSSCCVPTTVLNTYSNNTLKIPQKQWLMASLHSNKT